MPSIDWQALFVPTISLFELFLRSSAVYLSLFVALRIFRREAGALNTPDLLVIVLIADATQNAMGSDYKSLPEALVLVATIVSWNYSLDWLGYKYSWAGRLLHPKPVTLVEDGAVNRRNMRSQLITMDDLKEQLRQQGVEELSEVRLSCLESDGHISVVREDKKSTPGNKKQKKPIT